MKTVKIKVALTQQQESQFADSCAQLDWLWNKVRSLTLQRHCVDYYAWAAKQSGKLFPEFDLTGIIETPVQVDKRSAWIGVSCRIAIGGLRWVQDTTIVLSQREVNGTTEYRYGSKLVPGEHEYQSIKPVAYQAPMIGSKLFTAIPSLDHKKNLNELRQREGLAPLTLHSDYIGGLLKAFEQSWKAFLDPKRPQSKKPRPRDERGKIGWLINRQIGCGFDFDQNLVTIVDLGQLQITDRSYQKRIQKAGLVCKTYSLTKEPSGYYICATFATAEDEEVITLKQRAKTLKKTDQAAYEATLVELAESKQAAKAATKIPKRNDIVGAIDPGVTNVVATDHGALFRPNVKRERLQKRIESLQSELDKTRLINDDRWKQSGGQGPRPATQNEQKLARRISRLYEKSRNSGKHFNHKLSTRLARTYGGGLVWEDTDLNSLIKKPEPILKSDGTGYEENGSSEQARLNWRLRLRNLGQLREQTEQKAQSFTAGLAADSSQECHACGEIGTYAPKIHQARFVCNNSRCGQHNQPQHADTNAARNFARRAAIPLCHQRYNNAPSAE